MLVCIHVSTPNILLKVPLTVCCTFVCACVVGANSRTIFAFACDGAYVVAKTRPLVLSMIVRDLGLSSSPPLRGINQN